MSRSSGLTLVEVLTAIVVVAVLAGILVPSVSYVKYRSHVLKCAANLNHIAVATKLYCEDYQAPPMGSLRTALADYVDSPQVFVCPEDRHGSDSYSAFYVPRRKPGSGQFVVGCPRHANGDRGAVAFGMGHCDEVTIAPVTHNGEPMSPGEIVNGGHLAFSDGSTVEVSERDQVGLVMSFTHHGICHSVIFVPEGSWTQLRCQVTPGSRFEVLTPASILNVGGAKFDVSTGWEDDAPTNVHYFTGVKVHKGKVRVTDRRKNGEEKVVAPGLSDKTKTNGRWAPENPGDGKSPNGKEKPSGSSHNSDDDGDDDDY